MRVHVYIPTPFRRATDNLDRVSVEAADVRALIEGLEARFAGLKGLVRNEYGEVHQHVNIYVNSEAIEALSGLDTALRDGDEISIIPALAGGGARPGAHPAAASGERVHAPVPRPAGRAGQRSSGVEPSASR